MTAPLLALNVGSSTLKFTLFDVEHAHEPRIRLNGMLDGIGKASARFLAREVCGKVLFDELLSGCTHSQAIERVLQLTDQTAARPCAIVHRVVHGGAYFSAATVVDDEVMAKLASLIPLAPLHQPGSLAGIDAARQAAPDVPQIACFDTAFHTTQDELATRFGIANRWHEEGVRRYSFHGLSYAAIARRLPMILGEEEAAKRVIVLHLGSGSSACAMHNGRSIANSTGMSACEGLMMGTRPGNLDPEVVIYWMERAGMDIAGVREELYKRSGLLGVSGESSDMRELLASNSPRAKLAIALFCYRAAREVGALAVQLGGVDHIVFTAGIGERCSPVRALVLDHLAWLGFEIDHDANADQATCITLPNSQRHAWVIPTDEEGQMAREALALLPA